jgi:hypothetical protein
MTLIYLNYNHIQGFGKWIYASCSVKFNYIWLNDTTNCPYIILICYSIYIHPPAPLLKIPLQFIEEL